MRLQLETAKESEAKHIAMVQTLRSQLVEYQAQQGSIEGQANRSEVTIAALQRENKNYQERMLEMESRMRYVGQFVSGGSRY